MILPVFTTFLNPPYVIAPFSHLGIINVFALGDGDIIYGRPYTKKFLIIYVKT